nr:hypothetical protein [Tanacetum cinerariifolium]
MLDHQDKYMIKSQVHVSKSSAISDVQPLPRRKYHCQIYQVVKHMLRGRLLASFQDREHKGGNTRSQDGIKDNDSKIKIQHHSMQKKFPRTRLKVSRKAHLNDHPLGGDCCRDFIKVMHYGINNHLSCYKSEVQLLKSVSIPTEPSTSKPYKKHKSKKQKPQVPKVSSLEPSPKHMLPLSFNDPLSGGKDSMKLKELMDLYTYLSNKVLGLESEVINIKSTYKERIKKLKGKVNRLEEENRVLKELHNIDEDVAINLEEAQTKLYSINLKHPEKVFSMQDVDNEEPTEVVEVLEVFTAAKLIIEVVTTAGATTTAEATNISVPKRKRGFVIQDPEETTSTVVVHSEVQSKYKAKDINWNAVIEQVKRSERLNDVVMKYQALKRKPLTEAQARKNMIIYLKNVDEELNEEVTVPEKEVEVEGHKREGESLEKEITKKQKMDEEAEELKSHLQIISNDDDDV